MGSLIFKKNLNSAIPVSFKGKYNITYSVPNTIDYIGKELFINGVYEKNTIELIKKLLDGSSVFFDVGANIGCISLPVAKLTSAKIYAFEPSHSVFNFLKENVQQNNISSIVLSKAAVHSIHNKKLHFFATDQKYGGSSLSPVYNQDSYEVQSVSLDEYCKERNINKIDVLKIDVQGHEAEVLKGCQSLLKEKKIKAIIFEMESWAEKLAGYPGGASQQFLKENDYEIFTLKNEKLENLITEGSHMFLAKPKVG